MSDEGATQTPTVFTSKERAALVAKALSEAARRARFSTKRRRAVSAVGLRARRNESIMRLLRRWTFIGIVFVPCLLFIVYITLIASRQYEVETRLTLREGLPQSTAGLGTIGNAPVDLIQQDTSVVMDYLQSRALLDDLDKRIDVRSFYNRSDIDYFSRLSPSLLSFKGENANPSIESVLTYWDRRSDVSIEMPAGIIIFTMRAFSPQDAQRLAEAVLQSTEDMANKMNSDIKKESVKLAEAELQRAEATLTKARFDVEEAQNEEGTLNASAASTVFTQLMQQVQSQMITMEQTYETQRKFVRANAPQLRSLQAKIDAARDEIAKLQAQMTTTSRSDNTQTTKVLSGSMSRLEYANLENTIAVSIYSAAVSFLEQARIASDTKLMYVNAFVAPVAPQDSEYPKIPLDIAIVVASCVGAWLAVYIGLAVARTNMI